MKYFTANPIAEAGLKRLPEDAVKTETMEDADVVLVRSFSLLETDFPASVKAIARAGAGVNNIPLERCAKAGIVVFNTPGANANGVKELTLLGLLLASRDALGGTKWVEENKGDEAISKTMEKAKSKFAGTEIAGKTLGIIGLGAIGAKLANAAVSLGMDVIGYDPFLSVRGALLLNPWVRVTTDVDEVYAVSDYISVHVPETPDTKGMLNKEVFRKCKKGVAILNFARAGLVNEADLAEALESGAVRKYVTDVPTYATANLPNTIAFPHLGASTEEAENMCAVMAADELNEFLENGNIVNSVNFPAVSLKKKNGARTLVLFEGDENKAAEIAEALAPCGIGKCTSGVKKQFGAALFELQSVPEEALQHRIKEMCGVIRVYVLP